MTPLWRSQEHNADSFAGSTHLAIFFKCFLESKNAVDVLPTSGAELHDTLGEVSEELGHDIQIHEVDTHVAVPNANITTEEVHTLENNMEDTVELSDDEVHSNDEN
ncbi:hypothetical protein K7X08_027711 [Anisodus acutangulus]|uniref:Uncharacterized protein n=1 Tax=Anisodus acutangulus TaxID=402998 RepID=A0A9Q1LMZ2_9SOLA|nr:hypothetical protein K7X08_027711 [Anisodus acutangulus]